MTPSQRLAAQRAAQQAAADLLAKDLARRYGVAWQTVKAELDAITARIAAARAAGEVVDEAWLIRQGVLDRIAQAVQHETQVYVENASARVGEQMQAQQTLGAAHALALVDAITPPAFRPLEAILARTALGGPLAVLLDTIAPDAAHAARDALVSAVVAGDNPHQTARALKETLQAPLWRTLRIARTETIGAYRDGALSTYRANRNALEGWVWISKLSPRTCAACIAMHGSVHELSEAFGSHPSCRCTPAPITRSWAALGFPGLEETRLVVEPGPARFARMPRATQLKILGPGKLAAYEAGDLAIEDLAQPTFSRVWGPGLRERSLRAAIAS